MTVSELIEVLTKMPSDATILIMDSGEEGSTTNIVEIALCDAYDNNDNPFTAAAIIINPYQVVNDGRIAH